MQIEPCGPFKATSGWINKERVAPQTAGLEEKEEGVDNEAKIAGLLAVENRVEEEATKAEEAERLVNQLQLLLPAPTLLL